MQILCFYALFANTITSDSEILFGLYTHSALRFNKSSKNKKKKAKTKKTHKKKKHVK